MLVNVNSYATPFLAPAREPDDHREAGGGGDPLNRGGGGGGDNRPGETRVNLSSTRHSLLASEDESIDDIPNSFPTSGWKQFVILFKRTFLSIIRDGVSELEIWFLGFIGVLLPIY